jgi:ribosome maturation factor RimP
MQSEFTLEGRINALVSPSLEQLGYEIVRIKMIGDDSRKILQVMIERKDGVNVSVTDCQKASRQMSAILDVEESGLENYTLEVSSPGIDRPLTRLKDFVTYKGLEAKIEVANKIDEKRKFRGILAGTEDDIILLDLNVVSIDKPENKQQVRIKFDNVKSASLVLNDQLLAISASNNI